MKYNLPRTEMAVFEEAAIIAGSFSDGEPIAGPYSVDIQDWEDLTL